MVTKEDREKYREMIEELKEAGKYKEPVLAEEIVGRKVKGVVRKVGRRIDKPGQTYKGVRQLGTHLLGALTGTPVSKVVSKKGDRGRGRPRGTYKARVLPSGKVVRVPTAVYKKMLSAEKAQMRLLRVQAQMQAEQLAMQQDMRYQPSAEDQFLEEPDQAHEMELMRARQMAEMEGMEPEVLPKPSVGRRIVKGLGDFGRGVSRIGRPRPMVDQFGRLIEPQIRPQLVGMGVKREPRVTAVSERTSLLSAPSIFNNPGQSSILWNKRR